jgi:hypothetical protein
LCLDRAVACLDEAGAGSRLARALRVAPDKQSVEAVRQQLIDL